MDQGQGRCRWSLFLLTTLYQKHGHEVRVLYFRVAGESEPTTLRLQEFKNEGYSLSRPKGLTIICQLIKIWGMKEQRPTFPKQFLLCSLRVCKAHLLPVATRGGGRCWGRQSPLPKHLPEEGGSHATLELNLRTAVAWKPWVVPNEAPCGTWAPSTQAAASGILHNSRRQSWPSCM